MDTSFIKAVKDLIANSSISDEDVLAFRQIGREMYTNEEFKESGLDLDEDDYWNRAMESPEDYGLITDLHPDDAALAPFCDWRIGLTLGDLLPKPSK